MGSSRVDLADYAITKGVASVAQFRLRPQSPSILGQLICKEENRILAASHAESDTSGVARNALSARIARHLIVIVKHTGSGGSPTARSAFLHIRLLLNKPNFLVCKPTWFRML